MEGAVEINMDLNHLYFYVKDFTQLMVECSAWFICFSLLNDLWVVKFKYEEYLAFNSNIRSHTLFIVYLF